MSNHKKTPGKRRAPGYWQGIAGQSFAVVLGVGTAMGLRALLTPWIGESAAPFITAFPVIAAVAFFSGVGVGAATAVACALWVSIPLWPPYLTTTEDWRLLAVFVPAAFLVAFFGGQAAEYPTLDLATEPEGHRPPGTVRWLRWSMFAAAALPALFFAAAAWSTYRDAMRDAATRVDRAARVAVEQASKVFETNQVITRHVLTALGDSTVSEARARELELHEQLTAMVRDIPQIQSVWVIGSDGRAVVSNRFFPIPHDVDFSDREGFTVFQRGETGTYVTTPRIGRLTNEPFFDVATPWRSADGRLHGVVWVSLHPQYFTDFYAGLAEDEPSLLVKMFRSDGVILARRPPTPDQATRLPGDSPLLNAVALGRTEGMFDGPSMDGEHRVASFRKLERYPVYVATGVPRAVVLEAWQRRTALLAAFTFPTAMALIYIAWVALRRTRREFAAVRELHQEVEHRARAENALRQVQKLEALGRLTGGVAHDFNNLLMVVSNNLHLLRRLQPALADSRELAAIARAVGSGERLTRQLLAFARRQPLHPEMLSLQERLPALVALVAPTLGPRIESECVVDPDTPPVELDAAELELAIINLAVNAKDAMRDGGRFRVTARRARPEEAEMPGDFVVISVADTGAGIEADVVERVFEPFFTTKPHGQGTGLGLSQVYGLCTQAGGTARIESAPGRGTEVKLFLPAVARAMPAAVEAVAASEEPLHCTVLLVEDNEDLAGATQALLQRAGCRVHWARNGDRARDFVSAGGMAVDVVVSDMAMPGELDGLGLAEFLRQHHPELQVVLITGYASQLHEASARRFTVLAKPCPPDVLIAAIRAALKRRSGGATPTMTSVVTDKKSPVE